MTYFNYTETEIAHLKQKDPILSLAIERIGPIKREINPNLFESLVDTIIAQQISSAAAKTVYNRLKEKVGEITPIKIYELTTEDIQSCGMSMRKATYIKDVALSSLLGTPSLSNLVSFEPYKEMGNKILNLDTLHSLTDEEIIKTLSDLNGIGKWTAQILLIFSLQRKNIIAYDDLAIRRGMCILYGLDEITKETFEHYKKIYSPYATIASLYLWTISGEKVKFAKRTYG